VADGIDPHAGHDALLVAALLDDDLDPSERTTAEALIAGCPGCAALHADLVALAAATRAMPLPRRPRDYRLSAADVSRLDVVAAGEPVVTGPRLAREMTDTNGAAGHSTHDTILVASLADHSLPPSERDAAEALIASCGLCAALHADLIALAAATRSMPTPTRPRDYTLSRQTAARLRPTGWRRWVAAIGTSRDAFSRPLAMGLTTLGLAGLLVTTVPSALQVGSAAAPAPAAVENVTGTANGGATRDSAAPDTAGEGAVTGAAGAPSAPAAGFVSSAAPAPVASDRLGGPVEPERQSGAPALGDDTGGQAKGSGTGSGQTNDLASVGSGDASGGIVIAPMQAVSGALLLLGVLLFLLRRAARRVTRG